MAVLGALTNLVTGEFNWGLLVGVVVVVVLLVATAIKRLHDSVEDNRRTRARVLTPFTPSSTPPPGILSLLTPVFTPTPMWGRSAQLGALLRWCVEGEATDVVRVLCGPAGVGKTRLAVEVGRALPDGWFAGQATAAGVAGAVEACGDPTLVVVDDADQLSDLGALVQELAATSCRVRVLLVTRHAERVRGLRLPDALRPLLDHEPVRLGPVGGEEDRRRWFNEAVRGYSSALGVPIPRLLSVADADTMLWLHAGALLGALNGDSARVSQSELVERLLVEEVRRWTSDLEAPAGRDALREAVAALVLIPDPDALRWLPRYAHDAAAESRAAVADWCRDRFSTTSDGRLDVRPQALAEWLVLDTARRVPEFVGSRKYAEAVVAFLARTCETFPAAVALLMEVLRLHEVP